MILSTEESEKPNNLIHKYFDSIGNKLGKISLVEHNIIFTKPDPIKLKPYISENLGANRYY